ncbi:MAG TPA: ATP-binding protein [Candidatus Sulfopaludibacter sp.]|nr:ATP-binding protein [Candidatus Sulfopaludibacter sp.]
MSPGGSIQENGELPTGSPASLLQECLACGVLVVNARGRIAACTPEAAAHLRAKAERLRNAPATSLPAPLPRLIRDAAKSGQPATNLEIVLKPSRRDAITLRASVLPVRTRAQSQVVVVINNLTSAPVFEQNMRRLDRLASLGTLSASLAHEIKNGMVAIKTFTDLLLQKGQDTELTDVVSRELQRINAIVTQMLRFAAPRGAAFTTVHVHELLDHSLRLLHHQITGKTISLQRRYEAGADTVCGDDAQLQQAFMNLLLNALEAMSPEGVLTVATEITESKPGTRWLSIHIQDTGVGVAPENLERLFEPFFTTKKHGTGLGLAISQRIAQEHQGAIQVRSEVNRGSTFSFSLPIRS